MPKRISWTSLLVVFAVLLTAATSYSAFLRVGASEGLRNKANVWLASLDEAQKGKAIVPYESETRTDWHFIPKDKRKGLQIREMNADQRKAAHALLQTALSEIGYGKVTKIMEMEGFLKELEKGKTGTPLRDTERYYFTVFGNPTPDGRWGLSFEGHHFSINLVVEKEKVISSSPVALAANPAVIMASPLPQFEKGFRLLRQEEETAFALLNSLSAEQKSVAIIAEKSLPEVRGAGAAQPVITAPEGISVAKFSAEQKDLLWKLFKAYTVNMADEIASDRLEAIEKAGVDQLHFAWAGAQAPGIGHYYRIQGPTVQIEFVNVQPDAAGNPANHIHCVWRDARGDFALPIAGK